MKKLWTTFLLASVLIGSHHASYAHGFKTGELTINHPYATPSLKGSKTGAAYIRSIRTNG